jgi:hypothetical protein
MEPDEAEEGAFTLAGLREMLPVMPGCVTVKLCGAPSCGVMEMTPVRDAGCVFAAALKFTVPLPAPEAPEVIVSHDCALEAVQSNAVSFAAREIDPVPPEAATLAAAGLTVSVPPDCEIGKTTAVPDDGVTVTFALREAALGDAATVY